MSEKIPDGAQAATLHGVRGMRYQVVVDKPKRNSLRHLSLEAKHVFTSDDQLMPIDGYVVYSSTNGRGWYSFFETGWEHGELV